MKTRNKIAPKHRK